VTDRFVEQDAGPAGAQDDVHGAGRAGFSVETQHRDSNGIIDEFAPGRRLEQSEEIVSPPHPLITDFASATRVLGNDLHVQSDEWADVCAEAAVAPCDQYVLVLGDDARHDLFDPRIESARVDVDRFEQVDFFADGNLGRRALDRIQVPRVRTSSPHGDGIGLARALGDRACGGRSEFQALDRHLVRVRVSLALFGLGPHADALLEVTAPALDDAFFEGDRVRNGVFEVEVRIVDLALQGRVERAGQTSIVHPVLVSEERNGDLAALITRHGSILSAARRVDPKAPPIDPEARPSGVA